MDGISSCGWNTRGNSPTKCVDWFKKCLVVEGSVAGCRFWKAQTATFLRSIVLTTQRLSEHFKKKNYLSKLKFESQIIADAPRPFNLPGKVQIRSEKLVLLPFYLPSHSSLNFKLQQKLRRRTRRTWQRQRHHVGLWSWSPKDSSIFLYKFQNWKKYSPQDMKLN